MIPEELAEALADGTLAQPEVTDEEPVEERSAQDLFDELDAMEAQLPVGFEDLIKKHKRQTPAEDDSSPEISAEDVEKG